MRVPAPILAADEFDDHEDWDDIEVQVIVSLDSDPEAESVEGE